MQTVRRDAHVTQSVGKIQTKAMLHIRRIAFVFISVLTRFKSITSTLLHKAVTALAITALFVPGSVLVLGLNNRAIAAESTYINFQARILQSNGALVPDGTYHVEFKLYDVSTSGTALWTETRDKTTTASTDQAVVKNGYISVRLGAVNAFSNSVSQINWDQQLYLGMNIGGTGTNPAWDGEMSPRFIMTSVPYSKVASTALGVNSNNTSSTSTNSNSVTIKTGNATGSTSNSGNLTIDTGTATGTAGTISIAGTNASGLTLARSGLQTTIAGNALVQGGTLTVGTTSQAGSLVISDGSSNTVTLTSSGVTADYSLILPTAAGSVDQCLRTSPSSASQLVFGSCGTANAVTAIGTIDSQTKSANGAVIASGTLYMQTADATNVGLVSIGTQTFAGNKTFTGTTTFSGAANVTSGTLTVGADSTTNGTITLYSSGAVADPTISANASGDLTVQSLAGTTVVGDGSGGIQLQLQNAADVLTGTKTFTAASAYSSDDFSFTRTITGGANNLTGNVFKIVDNSTTSSGTFTPTLLYLNQVNTGAAGYLINAAQNGTSKFSVTPTGATTVAGALTVNNTALFKPSSNSVTAFQIQPSASTTPVLNVDTTNSRVGIGTAAPSDKLEITGGNLKFTNDDTGILFYSGERIRKASGNSMVFDSASSWLFSNALYAGSSLTAQTTLNVGVSAGSGALVNNGSTLNTTLAISNLATGGAIGTAAATVDIYTSATLNQTTTGQSITIPSPTSSTAGRLFYITNIGTASVTFTNTYLNSTLSTNTTASLMWTGSAWVFAGADGNGILNQNSTAQTANFQISGTGRANTSIQTPLVDTASAAALNVGTTNATQINLNKNTIITGTGTVKATSTSAFAVQNASAVNFLVADTTNSILKVYDSTGTNSANISYSGSTAIFAASSGTTQIGGGVGGNIQLTLNANADQLLATKATTPVAAYSLSDYNFTRNLTGTSYALTGSVLKVEDTSSFTTGSSSPNVLLVNQNNASATGNLILAQTGGATTRFQVTTAGNTTVGGTLAVTGNVTASANLTIGSGAGVGLFTNNGSTLNSTLAISNLATGGAIGTAAATVDVYSSANLNQTTTGQSITIPSPTTTTAGRMFYLSNIGTASVTFTNTYLSSTLSPNTTATLIWNGSAWQFAGADGNGILNQNSTAQTANFQISGTGRANTSIQTPTLDVASAGTLSVGNSTATAITLGKAGITTTNSGALTVTQATTLSSTLAVTGQSDFTASVAFKKGTDYSTTGSANDVALGDASLVRLTGASAQTITGIASGRDGRVLTIVNAAANSATISNSSTSSLAANRIVTGTGSDLTLAAGASISLIYDSGASLWRTVGGSGGGLTTIGTFSSVTSYANGAQLSAGNTTLTLGAADGTNPGIVSTAAQTFAGAKTFSALITGNLGLTAAGGAVSLNTTGTSNTAIGNATGTLQLSSNAFNVSTAGAVSGVTTLGLSGAITGATATNTINGLIINSGALSGITGYTQTSGNFAMSGTGTFGTGTGAISLNGATSVTGTNTFTVGTGATSLGGTLGVTGNVSANANLTVGSGAGVGLFTNNGATVNTTLAITNKDYTGASNTGTIGANTATVDIYTTASIAQTTAGQTLTVPSPTASTAYGRMFHLSNIGTASFTLLGITVNPGNTASLIWQNTSGGASWQFAGGGGISNGITSVGAISGTSNSNGATVTGTTLNLTAADGTNGGVVTNTTQTFAGAKAFSALITGNLGLTAAGGAVSLNTTGTSNTAIGNATGTFQLTSSALNISTAGALTGVTGITTSGGYTQSGSTANTFSAASTFSATSDAIVLSGTPSASATASVIRLGAVIAGGSASGTYIGSNPAAFSGDFINMQVGGAVRLKVTNTGATTVGNALTVTTGGVAVTGNSTIAGTLTSLTGLTSSGTITFSGLTASRALFTDASSNLATTGTSAALLNALSDETGTGVAVFGTSPTITTSIVSGSVSFDLLNTTATTINFGGAATTIGMGAAAGSTINLGTVAGTSGGTQVVKTINQSAASTSSAGLTLTTGNAAGATSNSGTISIDSGTATGTAGSISIGASNSSSLALGRTGSATTVNGSSITVNGATNISNSVAYKQGTAYSTIGTSNDVNFGDASLIRLTGASAQTITGIAGGRDGEIITLVNAASQAAIFKNNDAGSVAANRITSGMNSDLTLEAGASMTLVYDSTSSLWRVTGGGVSTTLQEAYTYSTSPEITLDSTRGALTLRNATSDSITGNLFELQNNAGTLTYFGVTPTGLLMKDSDNQNTLEVVNTSSSHELRVWDATGVNYANIYATTTGAVFTAFSGTTQIGTSGSGGNISLNLASAADQILADKTMTASAAYSTSDFQITRNITGGVNNLTGDVLYVRDTSTTSGTFTPNVLRVNQNNTGASGNLILAQTGGATTRFQVTTAGNGLLSGTLTLGTASSVNSQLIMNQSTSAFTTTIQPSTSAMSSSYTLTLPSTVGTANQCLQNSGVAGVLTFATCSLGAMTDNVANAFDLQEGTNDYININTTNSAENISLGNTTTNPSYSLLGTGNLTVGGNVLSANSATANAGTTSGTGTNVTTLTLAASVAAFANNDILFIDNVGQDYYTRIVSGAGTASLTVSPAITFEATRPVTEYQNVRNIGTSNSDYTTLTQRFFQGYFLGGVVTGTGSTTLSDGLLTSTGAMNIRTNSTVNAISISSAGGVTFTGNILNSTASANLIFNGASSYIQAPNVYAGGLTYNINAATSLLNSLTLNGSLSISGSGTLSTGTGAISLNGATSVTGTNTFTVGTGATSLGGTLGVTGNVTLATGAASNTVRLGNGGTAFKGIESCTVAINFPPTANTATGQVSVDLPTSCANATTTSVIVGYQAPTSITYTSGTCSGGFGCQFTADIFKAIVSSVGNATFRPNFLNASGATVDPAAANWVIWYIEP